VPDSSINQLLNWEVCFLCEKKTFKKDRKLKEIESNDRATGMIDSIINKFFAVKYFDDSLIIFENSRFP
jgi:hypothetical protein